MDNVKPKVLFTYVEAGMGHIIPMQGMANMFKKKYGDKCEIIESHIFSESENEHVRKMGRALADHTKKLSVNWFYNKIEAISYLFSSKFTLKILDTHFNKARKIFYKEFAQVNPDLTVATYYLPTHLAQQANKLGLTNSLIATYTPDPYIYPAWDRECDLFLVNNDEAYRQALKKGFKANTVKQIPFIYRQSITGITMDKLQARESVGVDKDRFTVLFTSGAYGAKGTEKLLKMLLTRNLNINLIAICGKNPEMEKMTAELMKIKSENTNFYVIGFTEKMAEYMRSADVMIGKCGTNTAMESAFLSCPMIINAEANRLEEKTAQFCVKEKIAKRIIKPKKIVEFIENAIQDPTLLDEITKGSEKYKKSNGDEMAADALYELLKTRFPNL